MPRKLDANYYFYYRTQINELLKEVIHAGGSKSWPKDDQSPITELLWENDAQELIKSQGFVIKTKARYASYNDGGQTIWTPETLTVMSPEFMNKNLIKKKMKKEFGDPEKR